MWVRCVEETHLLVPHACYYSAQMGVFTALGNDLLVQLRQVCLQPCFKCLSSIKLLVQDAVAPLQALSLCNDPVQHC